MINDQMLAETVNKSIKPESETSRYEFKPESETSKYEFAPAINVSEYRQNSPAFSASSSSYSTKRQTLNQSNLQRQLKNSPQQDISLIWSEGSNSPIKMEQCVIPPVNFAVYEQTLDDIQTLIPPKGKIHLFMNVV